MQRTVKTKANFISTAMVLLAAIILITSGVSYGQQRKAVGERGGGRRRNTDADTDTITEPPAANPSGTWRPLSRIVLARPTSIDRPGQRGYEDRLRAYTCPGLLDRVPRQQEHELDRVRHWTGMAFLRQHLTTRMRCSHRYR